MTLIQSMLESPYTHRLGWALLHSLWEGAAVALVLMLLLLLARKAAAQVRYAASCVAMVAAFALPIVTCFWMQVPTPQPEPVASARAQAIDPRALHAAALPAGQSAPLVLVEPVIVHRPPTVTSPTLAASLPSTGRPFRSRVLEWLQAAVPWVVLAWVAGVAALSLWNLGGWVALQRLKLTSSDSVSREICDLSDRLRRRLHINGSVRLLSCARAVSPMVIGVLKPVILLPASVLCELSAAQLESILAHELAHIHRHDYLANLLQSVIETLMFYHPAVWWIGRRMRIERENCCDDIALALTEDRVTYVRALTLVAARAPGLAPAATGGVLLARVRRILGLPADVVGAPRWLSGALVLAIAIAVGAILHPHSPASRAESTKPPQTQPTTMTLTILDQGTGQSIGGVNVSVSARQSVPNLPKAASDANGHVTLQLPRNDLMMIVWARKEGYVPTVAVWRNANFEDPIPSQFTLKLEHGRTIGGTIVDERRAPIPDAAVYVSIPRSDPTFRRVHPEVSEDKFTTDSQGKWRCNIIPNEAAQVLLRVEHPGYASDPDIWGSKAHLDELLKMTDVLVLNKGFTVKGRVLESNGQPLAGARVAIGPVYAWSHTPTAFTDAGGQFVLQHCRKDDQAMLVVTAKVHSPAVQQFKLGSDVSGIDVRLNHASPLIIRVINPQGRPLASSGLSLRRWHNGYMDGAPLQWEGQTDAQGRLVWEEAPPDPLFFSVYHVGYIQLQSAMLLANGREQAITLHPELKITGRVLDDVTGKPVDHVRVIRGWVSGDRAPLWERKSSRAPIRVSEGRFEFGESVERDGYAIRIEADGYLPAESKVFHVQDEHVELTFRLKKSDDLAETLVTPDGKPLAGADVMVENGSSQIIVEDGAPTRQTFTVQTKTDLSGHFSLSPQAGDFRLMVVHDRGFAELEPKNLGKGKPIVIPPWARVEGTARVGSKPAAGQTVAAMPYRTDMRASSRASFLSKAAVADDGHFRIEHVMPGRTKVGLYLLIPMSKSMWMGAYLQPQKLQAKAGETAHVDLGGLGRAVVGRVALPPSMANPIDWTNSNFSIRTRLRPPARTIPANWKQMDAQAKTKWNEQWRQSPQSRQYEAALEKSKYYPFKPGPDGTFRVDDVETGNYDLHVEVQDDSSPPQPIARGKQEFTIDPMPGGRSDQPLDLGTIGVTVLHFPKIGEHPPDFDVPSVDGKRIKLADYRGKYVVVCFWATWCGPCVAETPNLKATWDAFGKDPRFAMISLSEDDQPDAPRKFAASHQTPWPQGFIGPFAKTELPNQWGAQGIPSIFLVGPDGTILARGLQGSQIRAAVAQRLGVPG